MLSFSSPSFLGPRAGARGGRTPPPLGPTQVVSLTASVTGLKKCRGPWGPEAQVGAEDAELKNEVIHRKTRGHPRHVDDLYKKSDQESGLDWEGFNDRPLMPMGASGRERGSATSCNDQMSGSATSDV